MTDRGSLSGKQKNYVVGVGPAALRAGLAQILRLHPLPHLQVIEPGPETDMTIEDLGGTVRIGAVLDWVCARAHEHQGAWPAQVPVTGGALFLAKGIYQPDGSKDAVRLTGRERDFLGHLWRAPGHRMTRAEILSVIWGYAPGLETHTLETHVYRLRQKIEADPADPKILLTLEGGYQLKPL